ncbi:MAG: mannose-1-phosphate guanylyltransferase [Caldilineaceae bacterium]|nr:mannose-1-phosphate guanylyltransferase [Caldilineaceae bacterium]
MYAVILAGGSGTRLWPRSRQQQPKQFADIMGSGRTLIQDTAARLQGLVREEDLYVVVGEKFAQLAKDQLPQMRNHQHIVEPSGRNTGPAIGLACAHLWQQDPSAVVAFLPADHVIPQTQAFQAALRTAQKAAEAGYLVTLGITPTFAHTGYGYIKRSGPLAIDAAQPSSIYAVDRFLEKPDQPTAEQFLASGDYFWNGGIFISRVDQMMAEIERQLPDVHKNLQQIIASFGQPDEATQFAHAWDAMPNISIDYGIMEGATRVAMVPLDAGWNDVGSWDALADVLPQDADQNCVARGETLAIESQGNIIYSERLVTLIGVSDLAVIDTGDALLIGHKSQMQKVKNVVEELRERGRTELL